MNAIYLFLYRWSARHLEHGPGCMRCQKARGKRDKFHVLAWQHVSCVDATGEASKALPETLGKQLERMER
jgi:hypothetical protein